MDRQKLTFLIIANDTGETRRFVVSSAWVKLATFFVGIFLVALFAGVLDYFGLLFQSVENKRLKAENTQLYQQFKVVDSKVNALENSLERVKTFYTKLKQITNIENAEKATQLAINSMTPQPGQELSDESPLDPQQAARLGNTLLPTPTSINDIQKSEDIMFKPKTLNEQKGELAVEDSRDYATLVVRIDGAIKETQLREQSVIELWETLSEKQNLLAATPSIKPSKGWFTSGFGYRISPFTGKPAMHNGLDIAASPGSPVYAPADGIVSFAGYDEGYGKLVSIDHGYGVVTRYGHNSQIYVQVGQKVNRWDIIAAVGNTGRSTGPHCHYEVRVNNVPVNPINFILDE